MTRWGRIVVALVCVIGVASCVTKPGIPFDRSSNPVTTIGIIDPYIPERANVILAATVGQNVAAAGGLIGALVGGAIDESMRARRVNKFEDLIEKQQYIASDEFKKALETSLQAHGYRTVIVPIERPQAKPDTPFETHAGQRDKSAPYLPTDFRKTYPPPGDSGIEAYLDVVVYDYGYLSAGVGSAPYRPFVVLKCRLVRAGDGAVLMEDIIHYNSLGQPKNVVTVSPDTAYAYKDFDTMLAAGAQAIEGLSAAFSQTSDTLANLLR